MYVSVGHLVGPVLCHSFCNYMGFPALSTALDHPHRLTILSFYMLGVVLFFLLIFPMTDPLFYGFPTPVCTLTSTPGSICSWSIPPSRISSIPSLQPFEKESFAAGFTRRARDCCRTGMKIHSLCEVVRGRTRWMQNILRLHWPFFSPFRRRCIIKWLQLQAYVYWRQVNYMRLHVYMTIFQCVYHEIGAGDKDQTLLRVS